MVPDMVGVKWFLIWFVILKKSATSNQNEWNLHILQRANRYTPCFNHKKLEQNILSRLPRLCNSGVGLLNIWEKLVPNTRLQKFRRDEMIHYWWIPMKFGQQSIWNLHINNETRMISHSTRSVTYDWCTLTAASKTHSSVKKTSPPRIHTRHRGDAPHVCMGACWHGSRRE